MDALSGRIAVTAAAALLGLTINGQDAQAQTCSQGQISFVSGIEFATADPQANNSPQSWCQTAPDPNFILSSYTPLIGYLPLGLLQGPEANVVCCDGATGLGTDCSFTLKGPKGMQQTVSASYVTTSGVAYIVGKTSFSNLPAFAVRGTNHTNYKVYLDAVCHFGSRSQPGKLIMAPGWASIHAGPFILDVFPQ
jgi:hypothetical protein